MMVPPLLDIIVHRDVAAFDPVTETHVVGLTGLCAGFEGGTWRCDHLARTLVRTWLPEFALKHGELTHVTARTMGHLMARAANTIYKTKKFRKRGEFGELLLHAVLAQVFSTMPAVSKIYYKDTPNATVHGFDAVHVAPIPTGLELWLGEAKFYSNARSAIRSALASLEQVKDFDYLRSEFAAIVHMIDDSWPHADRLKRLLHENTSLDDVFDAACLPVLLTYDSPTLVSHQRSDAVYKTAIEAEWHRVFRSFTRKPLAPRFKVHLFLIPLATKRDLAVALDAELRRWQ